MVTGLTTGAWFSATFSLTVAIRCGPSCLGNRDIFVESGGFDQARKFHTMDVSPCHITYHVDVNV